MEQIEEIPIVQSTKESHLSSILFVVITFSGFCLGKILVEKSDIICQTLISPVDTIASCRPSDVGESWNVIVILPSPNTFVRAKFLEIEGGTVKTGLAFICTDVRLTGRTSLSRKSQCGILLCQQFHIVIGRL